MESPFDEEIDDEQQEEFEDFLEQQMDLRKFKDFTDDG